MWLINVWIELANQSRKNCRAVRGNREDFPLTFCMICFINSDAWKYIWVQTGKPLLTVLDCRNGRLVEGFWLLFERYDNSGLLDTFAHSLAPHQSVFCQLNDSLKPLPSNLLRWRLLTTVAFPGKNSHSLVWHLISYQLLLSCPELEKQWETQENVIANCNVLWFRRVWLWAPWRPLSGQICVF